MDEAKPKAYKTGPLPGGQLPEVGTLFNETMAEFTENIGPYALAGVGQMLVVFPVTFLAIFVGYALMGVGWFGAMMLTGILGGIVANLSEELAGLVMMIGTIGSFALPFLLLVPLILGIVALMAPLQASLYRAVAAQQRGEKPLELGSSFSSMGQSLMSAIVAASIVVGLSLLGVMMCYLPALLVPIFFGFTMGFAALHGQSGMASARMSLQHAMKHLNWHVMFGILALVLGMFASYVPVVGPMFALAFHVRAYRYVFGDGAEPNLTT